MISLLQFVTVSGVDDKRGPNRRGSLCLTNTQASEIRYTGSFPGCYLFDASVSGVWIRYGYEEKHRSELKHISAKIAIPHRISAVPKVTPLMYKHSILGIDPTDPLKAATATLGMDTPVLKLKTPPEEKTDTEATEFRKAIQRLTTQFDKEKVALLFPVNSFRSFQSNPETYRAYVWNIVNSLEWFLMVTLPMPAKKVFISKVIELFGLSEELVENLKGFREHPSFSDVVTLSAQDYSKIEAIYGAILGIKQIAHAAASALLSKFPGNNNAALFCGDGWHNVMHFGGDVNKKLYGGLSSIQGCRSNGFTLGDFVTKNA